MMLLTIVPLSTPSCLGAAAKDAALSAERLYLLTAEHPSARFIADSGRSYVAMDDLFATAEDFDALNEAIAARLFAAGGDAAFAVPGRGPGDALLVAIMKKAAETGDSVRVMPGAGYAEAALAAAPADYGFLPGDMRTVSAARLSGEIDPSVPLAIEEIDTPVRAGEVKLALSRFYPDAFPICLCSMDGSGAYSAQTLPLFELDRRTGFFAGTVVLVRAASFDELTSHSLSGLMHVMDALRAPGGCPWDAEQTHESLKSALLEESMEVLDAIDSRDSAALCEELGDVLLQVAFHAKIAAEEREFDVRDVCTGIVQKLVYRHPHVFGTTKVKDSSEVLVNWDALKSKEKHLENTSAAMRAVPRGFPALMRAQKIQKKAASVGFDWPDAGGALDKLGEEAAELREAMAQGDAMHIADELGDVLFSAVNAGRLLGVDTELAIKAATDKFFARFEAMERMAEANGLSLKGMTVEKMDELWKRAKSAGI